MTDMEGASSASIDIRALHKELDDASCPICMDHPHNAVLLICSSHEKGCKSFICDTSYRHSNCLDRFRKLKTNYRDNNASQLNLSIPENSNSSSERPGRTIAPNSEPFPEGPIVGENFLENHENTAFDETLDDNNNQEPVLHLDAHGGGRSNIDERTVEGSTVETNCLKCPLCRGNVLGWMIVKEARQYLDLKPRSCSRESCSFSGNYRELRRHARRLHPTTRPGDVDLSRQHAWHRLEHQREYGDIISAIRSAMPGAIVLGDYVIDTAGDGLSHNREGAGSGEGGGPWWSSFFLFHMINSPGGSHDEPRSSSRTWRRHRRSSAHRSLWGENLLGLQDNDDDAALDDDMPIPRRRRRFMRSRQDEEQQ